MDLVTLRKSNTIILDCISGSRAYGLELPSSDTDKRGAFYLPKEVFFGLGIKDQISNDTNDESYSEIGRMVDLLIKGNPTMIELLHTPNEFVLEKHPHFERLKPEYYLSKLCKNTLAGYAATQIKKARGLKKKILNPMDKERKGVLDFCFVVQGQGSISVQKFLKQHKWTVDICGLSSIPHMHEMYGLYVDEDGKQGFPGLISSEKANEVRLSSIPKEMKPKAIMSFNKSGYSTYCKEYKAYWEWVGKRNNERYENTLSHGKNYDAKNMMHTFRLLEMAYEIGTEGEVKVHRSKIDRSELLKIRAGEYEYEWLLKMAEQKLQAIEEAYEKSDLPALPNQEKLTQWLVEFRTELYT